MLLCESVDDSMRYLGKWTNDWFCVSNMCPPGWLYLPCVTWAVTSLATRPWHLPRRENANTGTILLFSRSAHYLFLRDVYLFTFFFSLLFFSSMKGSAEQTAPKRIKQEPASLASRPLRVRRMPGEFTSQQQHAAGKGLQASKGI